MESVVRRLAKFSKNTRDSLRELTYSGLITRMKDCLTHQVIRSGRKKHLATKADGTSCHKLQHFRNTTLTKIDKILENMLAKILRYCDIVGTLFYFYGLHCQSTKIIRFHLFTNL